MIRYGELDQALSVYTRNDEREKIPMGYYRRVIKLAIEINNKGKQWDMQQSAAILLYLAFSDGHLQPSQLTSSGLNALDYAEMLLQDTGIGIEQAVETTRAPVRSIGKK